MHYGGKRIDGIAIEQNIELHEIAPAVLQKFVIEGSVTARDRFQLIVEIENNFGKRKFVMNVGARRVDVRGRFVNAAPVVGKLHNRANVIAWRDNLRLDIRLLDPFNLSRLGHRGGIIDRDDIASRRDDAIFHIRNRRYERLIEFALQPLLDDFHVEQSKKPTSKSEAERDGTFRLVYQRRIVPR